VEYFDKGQMKAGLRGLLSPEPRKHGAFADGQLRRGGTRLGADALAHSVGLSVQQRRAKAPE
jgi:hypothetical protein